MNQIIKTLSHNPTTTPQDLLFPLAPLAVPILIIAALSDNDQSLTPSLYLAYPITIPVQIPIHLPKTPIPPKFRPTILVLKPQITPMVTNNLLNPNPPKLIIIPIINHSH
jgi:hypothetical protein